MGYVDHIVEAFSGVRPMAAAIGRAPSTVASWKDRGSIPDAHKAEVLRAARSRGIDLRPEHFFPDASAAAPAQGAGPSEGTPAEDAA